MQPTVVGDHSSKKLYSYSRLPLKKWIHLVFVWTGDSLIFYVNGKKNASCEASGITVIKPTDAKLRVGNGADMNNGLCGTIDNIILYNYPLSSETVKSHFEESGLEDLDIPVSPRKRRGCGGPKSGTELAFIPPIGFKIASMAKKRRKWWAAFVEWLNTL